MQAPQQDQLPEVLASASDLEMFDDAALEEFDDADCSTSCGYPMSIMDVFASNSDLGMFGDEEFDDADCSTSSCGSPVTAVASAPTPPTCAQNKRSGRDIAAETRPDKRIKTMTQFDKLPPSHLAPVETPPPSPLSLCRKEDWQLHVNDHFALKGGVEVKERQAEKMWALLMVWRSMHANNVAHFEVQSDTNVYGFTSVHVLDRASWDAQMLQLGLDLSRKPMKEPVSTVYEILMEYGGMQVDRSSGAKEPRNKSLKQDSYTFNAGHFAATKERVNRTRTAKRT